MNSSDSPTTVSQSVPSTKLEQQVQQLQEEIAQLRQENEQLRQQKETEFSMEIVNQQQKTTQQQTQALEKANPELWQPDRLLEITAIAASALLTIENFDEAVKTALQTIGEGLETDRVTVIENFTLPSKELPGWKVLYEWNSPHTVAQICDLNASQGCYEEIRDWHDLFCQGQPVSCQIEQMPEPFRGKQAAIGVKAFYLVPIFVEGRWWGVLGFDDCREPKHRTLAELAVLKIAANCIGSAIQRDRTQKAMLQAEQARSQELEHLNTELQQALAHLSESEERFRTLFELSSEGFHYVEIDPPCPVTLPIEKQCEWLYNNIHVVKANPAFAAMYGVDHPNELIGLKNSDVHAPGSEKNAIFIRGTIESGYRFRNLETEEIDRQGRLRYFLNSGVYTIQDGYLVNAWGTQIDITELRETQQALLEAEQARSQELERLNAELKQTLDRLQARDRILETTANAANVLLTAENLDEAINTTLQILGESLDTDRVAVLENFDVSGERLPYWRILYEWDSLHAPSQLLHPDATQGRYEDMEEGYEQFVRGQRVSYLLEEMPERLRVDLEKVGIKSTHIIPIFVEGRFWGVLGLDDCREAKRRSAAELAVLQIAADCIGSAIQRERTQQALLEAEQDRVAELAKANDALKQTVDALATETDFNRFLGHVLKVIAEQLDAPLTEYWYHPKPDNIAYVGLTYWQEKILKPEEQSGHVGLFGYPVPPEMIQQESSHHRRRHFITEDIASSEVHNRIAHEYGLDAGAWYQSRGVNRFLNMPLILGDRTIGALIVFLPSDRHFTEQQIELTYALAQQVTLAIQLTRLAEEAKQAAILEDRNRMAREIHDTLAQSFAGILMQLQAATLNLIDDPEQVIVHLKRASHLTREGLAEARRSVTLLLQEDTAYSDLLSSLHQLVEQMRCNTDVPISVNVEGTPYPLNPEVGMHLFRMVQESLNNALRHADPSTIQINLSYATQKVSLGIQDNGRGFDLEQPTNGFGLKGMQQRADLLNAQLQINSQISMGTEVHITAPTHSS